MLWRFISEVIRPYRDNYSNFAGTENGLLASTTNINRAVHSVVPLLENSIGAKTSLTIDNSRFENNSAVGGGIATVQPARLWQK